MPFGGDSDVELLHGLLVLLLVGSGARSKLIHRLVHQKGNEVSAMVSMAFADTIRGDVRTELL